MISHLKAGLTRLGALMSRRQVHVCRSVVNYIELGRWMDEHGLRFPCRLRSRWDVFSTVAAIVRDMHVLYLEFGVHHGDSIHYWASKLRNPATQLHGFDSFEGLPEAWGPYDRGYFDTRGNTPEAKDPRVSFYKGWFEDTLPRYNPPAHEVLVVLLDADLYSSTAYVLSRIRPWIRPGTFICLDDMAYVEHTPRAFREFIGTCNLAFAPVCADNTLSCVALRAMALPTQEPSRVSSRSRPLSA